MLSCTAKSRQIRCTNQPLLCSLCVIENALGHVTVDEWLFRIRPELGPRGNSTVTTSNGVFSVHHLCVCVCVCVLICACKRVCISVCMCMFAFSCTKVCKGLAKVVVSCQFWGCEVT